MKNERKHAWLFVQVLAVAALLFMTAPRLLAQATGSTSGGGSNSNPATNYNPPPCDFQDVFYNNVGISTSNVGTTATTAEGVDSVPAQRFALFRQTGPPAIFPG
jgi:choline dehydrogenase-like flavoprotein